MLRLMQNKAQEYFETLTDPVETFQGLNHIKQRRNFFIFFLHYHLDNQASFIPLFRKVVKTAFFSQQQFLDAAWGVYLHVSNKPQHSQLLQLLKNLLANDLLDKGKLVEKLSQKILVEMGVLEAGLVEKKISRAYTKNNFQQHKHSLVKENNQGYVKLMVLLFSLEDGHEQTVWEKILSLIGNFDLDPDRVLDLLIQAKLQKPRVKVLSKLIQKFKAESLAVLLGNKLLKLGEKKAKTLVFAGYPESFAQTSLQEAYQQTSDIQNPFLITLIADLVLRQKLSLQEIQKFLQPSQGTLQEINYRRIKMGQQRALKAFKISLQQLSQEEKQAFFHEDNLRFMGQLLGSSRLALATAFLEKNEWKLFEKLWGPLGTDFDLLLYQPLLNVLLRMAEWIIEPIYSKISFSRFLSGNSKNNQAAFFFQENAEGVSQANEISKQMFESLYKILQYTKDYVGFNHSLFVKLCRIFKAIKKGVLLYDENYFGADTIDTYIQRIIKSHLLPGLGYEHCNPTLGIQLYQLLELYPYQFRYECYLEVYQGHMNHNPYMAKVFERVKGKQNIIVNNLSKDNKKQFVKKLAKLTHNHALPVMYWVVRRLLKEDYEKVVPEIIGALNNATQLTLQMTVFLMLFHLNQNKQPAVNLKTAELKPWFKNIITFLSLFYRKYLDTDLVPLFDFVILKTSQQTQDLQDNEQMPGAYLRLVHELLNKMIGSFVVTQVNKAKYQILATGSRLQFQLLYLSSEFKAAKKSRHTIENFFWEKTIQHNDSNSLAFNLLVLLCQKRAEFLQKTYIENLKIVGDNYDEFTMLIIQLTQVLAYLAPEPQRYLQILPKNALNLLINKYKVPIEIAFEIIRPGKKHIAKMSQEEWDQSVKEVSEAFDQYSENQDYFKKGYNTEKVDKNLMLNRSRVSTLLPRSFLTAFWLLTLDSIHFPEVLYSEKLEEMTRKLDPLNQNRKEKNERQNQKIKALHQKISREKEVQKEKYVSTMAQENMKKLQIPFFKTSEANARLIPFVEAFVQICVLPRLLLDPREALYCIRFVILVIKANKLSSSKSIRFLTYMIEFVINYLPSSTKREAQNCLAIFLSEIFNVFINWNDQAKLKEDLKIYLDIEDFKDNYLKLREYLLKLFQRAGILVTSIREEPYIIKNCLYLLERLEAMPAYREQAQQIEDHLRELREVHSTVDMKTILDMQIAIINAKKSRLPGKPDESALSVSSQTIPKQTSLNSFDQKKPQPLRQQNQKPAIYMTQQSSRRDERSKGRESERRSREKNQGRLSKQRERRKSSTERDRAFTSRDRLSKERETSKPQSPEKRKKQDNKKHQKITQSGKQQISIRSIVPEPTDIRGSKSPEKQAVKVQSRSTVNPSPQNFQKNRNVLEEKAKKSPEKQFKTGKTQPRVSQNPTKTANPVKTVKEYRDEQRRKIQGDTLPTQSRTLSAIQQEASQENRSRPGPVQQMPQRKAKEDLPKASGNLSNKASQNTQDLQLKRDQKANSKIEKTQEKELYKECKGSENQENKLKEPRTEKLSLMERLSQNPVRQNKPKDRQGNQVNRSINPVKPPKEDKKKQDNKGNSLSKMSQQPLRDKQGSNKDQIRQKSESKVSKDSGGAQIQIKDIRRHAQKMKDKEKRGAREEKEDKVDNRLQPQPHKKEKQKDKSQKVYDEKKSKYREGQKDQIRRDEDKMDRGKEKTRHQDKQDYPFRGKQSVRQKQTMPVQYQRGKQSRNMPSAERKDKSPYRVSTSMYKGRRQKEEFRPFEKKEGSRPRQIQRREERYEKGRDYPRHKDFSREERESSDSRLYKGHKNLYDERQKDKKNDKKHRRSRSREKNRRK